MTEPRSPHWIQTYTGIAFYPLDPRPEEVDIIDIAHALSMQCRYTGHVNKFYSVAEHCIYASHLVPAEYALVALLHDASEAYLSDIARPIKHTLAEYKTIEAKLEEAICARFRLPYPYPDIVKKVDTDLLFAERRTLFNRPAPFPWTDEREPPKLLIKGMHPREAERAFLARFNELTSISAVKPKE